ncbi:hydroxyacid oxidase 1 [Culex quinquefasciatus]|uniref:(S)-2-hydroxy-acid oxidase n=1 Tax=Culex quinquefasciatus TaxID=7176 RepID=B0X405_CULQU|nr:hydroxyacid oxidase 1 [Culex quinquefasciatus]|eukprot:XP_001864377.1 hydroxyacid oxidase 1 [Culex quinquefasciatus]
MFDTLFRGGGGFKRSNGPGANSGAPGASREITCIAEFESRAAESLDRNAFDFFRSGAGGEQTARLNRSCFERIRIRPRCLARVGNRSLAATVLGHSYLMPIGIGPIGLQRLAHSEGERATARAARAMGVPFVLSALSSVSIEELAEVIPKTPKWFQLYIFKDREMTENLIRRAERARYKALVVTVDAPVVGLRRSAMKHPTTLPSKVTMANFCPPHNNVCQKNIGAYVRSQLDPTIGWDSLRWLLSITSLPVVVKGVLSREDALMAADLGVQGIIVSNHGGCQLDGAPATIEVLPEVVEAVGNRVTVMMDGGITQGTDVYKALALGAKMVFIGRAALWGLAVNGQHGVEDVLDLLRLELDSAMAISGCKTVKQICENHVRFESEYLRPRPKISDKLYVDDVEEIQEIPIVGRNSPEPGPSGRDSPELDAPPPLPEPLIPTGEDGLEKFPQEDQDGVDECGQNTSQWCRTVNSAVEVVRAPPRATREVRVVPEVAKVLQRNMKTEIGRRQQQPKWQPKNRAASMHNLSSLRKSGDDCRCIF